MELPVGGEVAEAPAGGGAEIPPNDGEMGGEAWSPINRGGHRQRGRRKGVVRQRRNRVRVTREEMFNEAHRLAKRLADTLQNLPLPAFQGYLNVLEEMIGVILRNEPLRLVVGGKINYCLFQSLKYK